MTNPDLIGHIGYASIIVGTMLVAWKDIRGWWPRMFGDVLVATMGIMLGVSSIWLWGSVFLLLDVYGYRKWKKEL